MFFNLYYVVYLINLVILHKNTFFHFLLSCIQFPLIFVHFSQIVVIVLSCYDNCIDGNSVDGNWFPCYDYYVIERDIGYDLHEQAFPRTALGYQMPSTLTTSSRIPTQIGIHGHASRMAL